jgi:hypothetical protein
MRGRSDPLYTTKTSQLVALHWNGVAWKEVMIPVGFTSVSTWSLTDAWAVGTDFNLYHWDGHTWTLGTAVPGGYNLEGVTMASPAIAYAWGNQQDRPIFERFNGKTWSLMPLAKSIHIEYASGIAAGSPTSVWVTGIGGAGAVVLHSTGTSWTTQALPKGVDDVSAITAVNPTHAFAGGIAGPREAEFSFIGMCAGAKWTGIPSKF